MPFLTSISSNTMSASCAPPQAVVTIARSSRRGGAKMPGVSISTSCASPTTATPRTTARVVCTLRETIETFEPTSALVSVDLPAFGVPIRATKPQRRFSSRDAGMSLLSIRVDAYAGEHRGGGGLLGRTLRAADALGGRALGDIHGDAEFRIVVRALALDLPVAGRRQPAPLRPFLQHRLRIAQRPCRRHHPVVPQPLDQRGGGRGAAVDEHRADQRLAYIGKRCGAPPAPRAGFRAAKSQRRAQVDRARHVRTALAAHQIGEAARKFALVPLREGA